MYNNCDLVVIGGGTAGLAAATFLARSKWKVLVIERPSESGFLGSLGNVSYFPGFPDVINGRELIKRMRRQAELVGAHFLSDIAKALATGSSVVKISTEGGKELDCRAAIIATGAAARTNYLHGEKELFGKGVSHDAAGDGPGIAKRVVAVIGRTKHAAEEALILSRFAEKVHFIIPANKMDVDDSVLKKLQSDRAIELHFSTSLKKINGTEHVSSITVFSIGQEKEMPVAGVFTYVHDYQPTTGFLGKDVTLAANGAVKVDPALMTSAEGVFACGDCICGRPQMPAIAAAQGLIAAMSADKYLAAKRTS